MTSIVISSCLKKNASEGRDVLDLCELFNLDSLVKEPTRVTPTSKTLIDVILTNNKGRFLSTGTLEPHISDHRLIYTIMRTSLARKRSRKIICRTYKAYDKERFVSDLTTVPFQVASIFEAFDDQALAFSELFLDIANEHAPIKQFHIHGAQVPYMTSEWRHAIRQKQIMEQIQELKNRRKLVSLQATTKCVHIFEEKSHNWLFSS